MPLDTLSTYSQTLLRNDGRRWNELRHLTLAISTQAASADGSSLLTIGNTTILCTVTGPRETRGPGSSSSSTSNSSATIDCEVHIAPFASGTDRRVQKRGDKRVAELQLTIAEAFRAHLFVIMYPRSTISIALHVLSLDGGLLAGCLNAASLALVDAGVPMPSLLAAVTAGVVLDDDGGSGGKASGEPVLDLNGAEEIEMPFMTVGSVGGLGEEEDKVSVLVMETRCPVGDGRRLEGMMAVGVDGCRQVREMMENTIRKHGVQVLRSRKG